jgi:hypothetical protein
MKEYRIIRQGSDFIVQQKRFWWWRMICEIKHFNPHGPSLESIVRFPSHESAVKYIEDLRPKNATEIIVVESRIIL